MIKNFKEYMPEINSDSYISEKAEIIGRVYIKKNVSVWPNSVLRGDVEEIVIGENTNIQEGTLIHTNFDLPVIIGNNVTVGHGAILHGCRIADFCLIGMGAIMLDGSEVGEYSIIAAGALVPEGKKLESFGVYMGMPARKVRDITIQEKELIEKRALEYIELMKAYK